MSVVPRFRIDWRAGLVVLSLLGSALGACGLSQSTIIHERNERANRINAHFDQLRIQATLRWNDQLRKAEASREALVKTDPISLSPLIQVRDSESVKVAAATCRRLEVVRDGGQASQSGIDLNEDVRKCWGDWAQNYVAAVKDAYPKADHAWVWKVMKDAEYKADIEILAAASHNATIETAFAERKFEISIKRRRELEKLDAECRQELAEADAAMMDDLAEARARRQAAAAFLQGVGAGMSAAGSNAPEALPATEVVKPGCSSDFECGMGFACIKPNFSTTGTCMRSVDSSGGQRFDLPRLDSVGPKMLSPTDCPQVSCPAGFSCDFASGACVRP